MNQNQIGRFIAELRKEHGWTQKELAQQLQITDKAVSKWECGNSMPDHGIMVNLCDILGISVNELLSGERLSSFAYNEKAEENIMTLMQERSESEKKNRKQTVLNFFLVLVLIGLLMVFMLIPLWNGGLAMSYFIDIPSLVVDVLLMILMIMAAKKQKDFFRIFRTRIHKSPMTELEVKESKDAAGFAVKAVFLSGGIQVIIYFINWMRMYQDVSKWGPNLAVMVLSIFYSMILAAILLILRERI